MGEEVGGRMVKCAKIFVRLGLFEFVLLRGGKKRKGREEV